MDEPVTIEWLRVAGRYRTRARDVYWLPSDVAACRASGPHHARCVLEPDHPGDHYGNGFDKWGPTAARRWERADRETPGQT
jgi:hypothetical protein